MKSENLRYIIEIKRRNSISAAAEALYLNPGTLSNILKETEQELGFPIFNRTHSGVKITQRGEEALNLAIQINACIEDILNPNAKTMSDNQPVSLITSPSIGCGLLNPLEVAYRAYNPEATLDARIVSGEEVGLRILQGDVSIGVTYFGADELKQFHLIASRYQIQADPLYCDHLYVLMRHDFPLAGKAILHSSEFQHVNMAMLPYYNASGNTIMRITHFDSNNRYTVLSSIPLIKRAVLNMGMVAILSGYAIQYDTSVPLDNYYVACLKWPEIENELHLCVVRRSDSNLRFRERQVVKCIEEYFRALQPPNFSNCRPRNE